jgi:hypothetical protein
MSIHFCLPHENSFTYPPLIHMLRLYSLLKQLVNIVRTVWHINC